MWEYFFAHCLANQGQIAHASGPMAYSSFHKVSLNRPPDHMASPTWSSQNKWLDQLRNDSTDPTGDLWRYAVDRGHGGATTQRPSPATRQ